LEEPCMHRIALLDPSTTPYVVLQSHYVFTSLETSDRSLWVQLT